MGGNTTNNNKSPTHKGCSTAMQGQKSVFTLRMEVLDSEQDRSNYGSFGFSAMPAAGLTAGKYSLSTSYSHSNTQTEACLVDRCDKNKDKTRGKVKSVERGKREK